MQNLATSLYLYIDRKYISKQRNRPQQSHSRQIDLDRGETINVKGITAGQLHNEVCTRLSLIYVCFRFIKRPGNCIFILLNIICLPIIGNQELHSQYLLQFILPLIASIFAYTLKSGYFENVKRLQDNQINKRMTQTFKKIKRMTNPKKQPGHTEVQDRKSTQVDPNQGEHYLQIQTQIPIYKEPTKLQIDQRVSLFELQQWDQLKVGDIIMLQRNECCPADVLILETSSEICNAQSAYLSGTTKEVFKKANILTSIQKNSQLKGNVYDYRMILSGSITYDRSSKENEFYQGYVKLKNDPQAIEIEKNNIFFRQQVLYDCDYIYGLVLYAGQSCRCYKQLEFKRKNKSFFARKIDVYYQFTLILIGILSLLSWTVDIIAYNRVMNVEYLAELVLQFLNLIPYYLYCILDLVQLVNAVIKGKQFSKQDSHGVTPNEFEEFRTKGISLISRYQQVNDTAIADLSLIDCVIFDKTGTLTEPKFKIRMMFICDTLFHLKHKSFRNTFEWKQFKSQVQEMQQFECIMEESESPLKQISSVKISPHHQPMSPTKKLSLIPAWKLNEGGVSNCNCDQQFDVDLGLEEPALQFQETSQNQEEANFNPIELEDDHPKLKEMHRSRIPRLFRQDSPWGTQTELINPMQQVMDSRHYGSRRKGSEKFMMERGLNKKKMSGERNFPKYNSIIELKVEFDNNEDLIQNEKQVYIKLISSETKPLIQEALFVLAICHNSQTKYNKFEDNLKVEYFNTIDQMQIELASHYDYSFICSASNKSRFVIQIQDNYIEVPVIIKIVGSRCISVIVKVTDLKQYFTDVFSDDTDYVQYIREDGLDKTNLLYMDKEDKEGWDSMIHKLHTHGCRPIVYYRCQMTEDNYLEYKRQQSDIIKDNNYELISVIGIQEKMRKSVPEMVKLLNGANITTWLASGDKLERVLPIAYQSQLLRDNLQIVHFNIDTPQMIKQQIQYLYNQVKNHKQSKSMVRQSTDPKQSPTPLKRKSVIMSRRTSTRGIPQLMQQEQLKIKSYALLINGEILDQLINDQYLFNHMAFIIYFSNQLVGYNMRRHQKNILLQMLQKQQGQRNRVMVVGDQLNDCQMMTNADVAVQFKNTLITQQVQYNNVDHLTRTKKEYKQLRSKQVINIIKPFKDTQALQPNIYINVPLLSNTDLVINNYKDLILLLFHESKIQAVFIENILTHAFYRSYIIGFSSFLLQSINQTTIYIPLHFYQSIFFILSSALIIRQSILSLQAPITDYSSLNQYYKLNQITFKKKAHRRFIYKILGISLIESTVVVIIGTTLNLDNSKTGRIIDEQMFQYCVLLILLILELSKLLSKLYWITSCSIVALYLMIYSFIYIGESDLKEFPNSVHGLFYILLMLSVFYLLFRLSTSIEPIQIIPKVYSKDEQGQFQDITRVLQLFLTKIQKESDQTFAQISNLVSRLFKNEDEIDQNIKQMLSGIAITGKSTQISKYAFQFQNAQLEAKYQISQLPYVYNFYRTYYPLTWIILQAVLLIQIFANNQSIDYGWFLYFSVGYNGYAIMLILLVFSSIFKKYIYTCCRILLLSRITYKIIYDIYFFQNNVNNLNDVLIMQFFMLLPINDKYPLSIVLYNFILCVTFIIRFSSVNTSEDQAINIHIMANYYLITIVQMVLIGWTWARLNRLSREQYVARFDKLQKINYIQDTLSILMPKFIRNRIHQKQDQEYNISENQGEVAIIFCDICQFDTIIKMQQQNVVHLLDQLFRSFDSLSVQFNLQKIETVGKTYMAAAGLKDLTQNGNVNPVYRAIQMAIEMQKAANECRFGLTESVIVKIGVHYGLVIAGVIGDHKPQFSLIGDTVNTTSRICSTGLDGQIKISDDAFRQVASCQDWSFQQALVEAKGKGKMITYLVSTQSQRVKKQSNKFTRYKDQQTQKQIFFNNTAAPNMEDNMTFKSRYSVLEQRGKKPSIIVPSIKVIAQSSLGLHKSSANLEHFSSKHSHVDNLDQQLQQQQGPKTLEGQNLIESLELKLQKDTLYVDEIINQQSYEVERDKIKRLYQHDDDNQQFEDQLVLDPKTLYLDFVSDVSDEDIETFRDTLVKNRELMIQILNVISTVLIIVQTVLVIMVEQIFYYPALHIIALILGSLVGSLQAGYTLGLFQQQYQRKLLKEKNFMRINIAVLIWWMFSTLSIIDSEQGEIQIGLGILISQLIQMNPIPRMKYKVIIFLIQCIVNIIAITAKEWDYMLIYYALMLQIYICTYQYYTFYKSVQDYNERALIDWRYQQYDDLIKHQLPKHILDQFLNQGQERKVLIDSFDEVTLLFADIAGFTEYSSRVSPEQVVHMLRNLFTKFDQVCQESQAYKLYTIGDCYVVMGMLDANDRNIALEAKNVVEMGFEMIRIIKEVRDIIHFQGLDMRIGIHTGNIIGGVLGTEIVRYDIYGPDVLIANKMESNGSKGKVHVSNRTREIIDHCYPEDFRFVYNKSFEFPAIERNTDGYFVFPQTKDAPSIDELKQDY